MELIKLYFPDLSEKQISLFSQLYSLYLDWNQKINVISRKDIEHLYLKHVLHSLSIAKVYSFKPGTTIIDIGTGGGFPGIPLAIYFPDATFYLIDSIGKKIKVVHEITAKLNLKNITAKQENAKLVKGRFDFSVSRAVAPLTDLVQWSRPLIKKQSQNVFKNGLICLKGGDVKAEINEAKVNVGSHSISNFFAEPFFMEKYMLHVPLS